MLSTRLGIAGGRQEGHKDVNVSDIMRGIVNKLAPLPEPPPDRKLSTPEDVRWMQRSGESLKRDAEMLGIDVHLESRG